MGDPGPVGKRLWVSATNTYSSAKEWTWKFSKNFLNLFSGQASRKFGKKCTCWPSCWEYPWSIRTAHTKWLPTLPNKIAMFVCKVLSFLKYVLISTLTAGPLTDLQESLFTTSEPMAGSWPLNFLQISSKGRNGWQALLRMKDAAFWQWWITRTKFQLSQASKACRKARSSTSHPGICD